MCIFLSSLAFVLQLMDSSFYCFKDVCVWHFDTGCQKSEIEHMNTSNKLSLTLRFKNCSLSWDLSSQMRSKLGQKVWWWDVAVITCSQYSGEQHGSGSPVPGTNTRWAWNEGYPKVRDDFTIREKALSCFQWPFSLVSFNSVLNVKALFRRFQLGDSRGLRSRWLRTFRLIFFKL